MKDEGIVYRFSLMVVPFLLSCIIRIWFSTIRFKVYGDEFLAAALATKKPIIATFWHYSLLMVLHWQSLQKISAVAMVSSSRDGEYTARILQQFGMGVVRGSKNRKGVQALKEMMKVVATGNHCALVADGSQGPALVVQPGSILLASRTGSAILPIICTSSSYWTIRSWDRLILPKPFSTVTCHFSEPLHVPDDVKTEGIEEHRMRLQEILIQQYAATWKNYNKQAH